VGGGGGYLDVQQDSTINCLRNIVRNEGGFPGLYKGLQSKLLQTVSTAAFMFLTYEKTVQLITSLQTPR
jgi:adenine nucleotide transporter 17